MGKIQIPRPGMSTPSQASGASAFRSAPRPFAPVRPGAVQRKEGDATATLTDYLDTRSGERNAPVIGSRFGTPMAVNEKKEKKKTTP